MDRVSNVCSFQTVFFLLLRCSFVIAVAMWAWQKHRAAVASGSQCPSSPSHPSLSDSYAASSAPPEPAADHRRRHDDDAQAPASSDSSSGSAAVTQYTVPDEGNSYDDWLYEVTTCIARLGVIILYFFICDRSVYGALHYQMLHFPAARICSYSQWLLHNVTLPGDETSFLCAVAYQREPFFLPCSNRWSIKEPYIRSYFRNRV